MKRWDVIAQLCPDAVHGAEIGMPYGENLAHLMPLLPRLYLLTVDPYLPYDEEGMDKHKLGLARLEAIKNMQRFPGRVFWREASSVEAAEAVLPKSLDFVFIDAAHDEMNVRRDVGTWKLKVKPGGWLIGHDASWPGVDPVVKDLGASLYDDDVWAVKL